MHLFLRKWGINRWFNTDIITFDHAMILPFYFFKGLLEYWWQYTHIWFVYKLTIVSISYTRCMCNLFIHITVYTKVWYFNFFKFDVSKLSTIILWSKLFFDDIWILLLLSLTIRVHIIIFFIFENWLYISPSFSSLTCIWDLTQTSSILSHYSFLKLYFFYWL